jgi:hypothetical protein
VCTAGMGNVLQTSVCTSPTVLEPIDKHEPRDILQDVITVSLLQKGHNDRTKNVVFVFNGIQWPMHNFELSATFMTNSSTAHAITLPAPKRSDSYTHWSVEHSH